MPTCRVPAATYRIQFTPGVGFADALAFIPYLHALGITDLYASPFFRARLGSLPDYDVRLLRPAPPCRPADLDCHPRAGGGAQAYLPPYAPGPRDRPAPRPSG